MWLENPLSNIDSDQMEITLNELQKSILRSAKFFHHQPSKCHFIIQFFNNYFQYCISV